MPDFETGRPLFAKEGVDLRGTNGAKSPDSVVGGMASGTHDDEMARFLLDVDFGIDHTVHDYSAYERSVVAQNSVD